MGKTYSHDFRKCVMMNYKKGKSRSEILSMFQIGSDTLSRWVRQEKETGKLEAKKRGRYKTRKLDDEELRNFIEKNPNATLQEIAEVFGVCFQAVWKRLKILGITRKKNRSLLKKR